MAKLHTLSLLLGLFLVVSADPPKISPSPAPLLASKSPSPLSPSPEAKSPVSTSPELSSPPAPPLSAPAPGSSPTPSPAYSPEKTTPAPAPTNASGIVSVKSDMNADAGEAESSDGLKGGQKAGIVFGVIAGACLVVFGGMVYKKRQQNIRRSQYGYAVRTELL